jgi:hypothetical protein
MPLFKTDATVTQGTHKGVPYLIGLSATGGTGVRWAISSYDHLGRFTGFIESPGAFYDSPPQTAYNLAEQAVKKYIEINIAGAI